jgi:hypothetical protein
VILYEKLGLPVLKKTAKGQPSTAEEVLAKLAEDDIAAQSADGVPLHEQAEKHLHRPPAGADQPAHRAYPHVLPSGGGVHRAPVFQRSEPAEHSGAHR